MKLYLGAAAATVFIGAGFFFLPNVFESFGLTSTVSPAQSGNVTATDDGATEPAASLEDSASESVASTNNNNATKSQSAGSKYPVMVALASASHISEKFDFVLDESGFTGGMRPMIDGSVDMVLSALDQDKPSGAVFKFGGDEPTSLWCFPVTELEDFEELLGNLGTIKKGDPISKFQRPGNTPFYFKYDGTYVYASNEKSGFEMTPEDPETLFGEALSDNLIFTEWNIQGLPESDRKKIWDRFSEGFRDGYQPRTKVRLSADEVLDEFSKYAADLERFSTGIKIDQDESKVFVKTELTALDGSTFAKSATKEIENKPTRFAGFHKDINTGASVNYCSSSTDSLEWLQKELERIEEQTDVALMSFTGSNVGKKVNLAEDKEIVRLLKKTVEETIESGTVDFGANFCSYKGQPNFAFGVYVADASHIKDGYLNDLEARLNSGDTKYEIQKNVARHKGIVFHQFATVDGDPSEKAPTIIGFGDDTIYFANGNAALKALKHCILNSEESGFEQSMFSVQSRFLPWVSLAGELDGMDELREKLKGHDKMSLLVQPIQNGYQSSTSIDLGIFTGAMQAIQMIGARTNAQFDKISRGLEASKVSPVPQTIIKRPQSQPTKRRSKRGFTVSPL